jgi:capsular exopolysaccharide synthesis family protein
VLLVDADLRRPSVHGAFQLDNRVGLSDVLRDGTGDGKLPVHQISANLWVLPAGKPTSDPMSLLISETMGEFLVDAAEQFDWVVLDTPPVALLPDANLLAAMIDAALLVVRANSTPYPLSVRAIEAIGTQKILGVVLNRAEKSEVAAGYNYYSYSYSHSASAKPRRRFGLAFRKT